MSGAVPARFLAGAAVLMVAVAACAGISGMRHRASAPTPTPAASSAPKEVKVNPSNALTLGLAGGNTKHFEAATGATVGLSVFYISMAKPVAPTFVHWAESTAQGAEPVIEILPRGASLTSIIAGQEDDWLRSFGRQVNEHVVLSFAPEANGGWYPWGGHPAKYRAAWRHVVSVLHSPRITWMWQLSAHTGLASHTAQYWPGSRYVDWAGLDGYYADPGATWHKLFAPAVAAIRTVTKAPLIISETSVGPATAHQVVSLTNMFAGIKRAHLFGLIWFDRNQQGSVPSPSRQNWNLESRPKLLGAFRSQWQQA